MPGVKCEYYCRLNLFFMKSLFAGIIALFICQLSFGWGQTGHRVVGEVAERSLNPKAQIKIADILNGQSLAQVSNWMDNIKSDPSYDSLRAWHYVSIPDGLTYEESEKNEKGDLITACEKTILALKSGELSKTEEAVHLKILVHLIGDLHQPLHVGRVDDRGGNDIKVEFFWKKSNLHRVWDSEMIDSKQYSFTELADIVCNYSQTDFEKWQKGSIRDRAHEVMPYRAYIYDLPDDKKIGYEYRYQHWNFMKSQLAKGGVYLARILNEIYGN